MIVLESNAPAALVGWACNLAAGASFPGFLRHLHSGGRLGTQLTVDNVVSLRVIEQLRDQLVAGGYRVIITMTSDAVAVAVCSHCGSLVTADQDVHQVARVSTADAQPSAP